MSKSGTLPLGSRLLTADDDETATVPWPGRSLPIFPSVDAIRYASAAHETMAVAGEEDEDYSDDEVLIRVMLP
jgi:hypothetical protein